MHVIHLHDHDSIIDKTTHEHFKSSLTTTSFLGSYLMYRQHVLIQLYSLRLGRLVSPSLFRPRYFQRARYGYYPSVFIWLWAEVWPQDAWWCCRRAVWKPWCSVNVAKLSCMRRNGIIRTACPAPAEWMDGCGAASAEARMWMCSRLCRTTTAL